MWTYIFVFYSSFLFLFLRSQIFYFRSPLVFIFFFWTPSAWNILLVSRKPVPQSPFQWIPSTKWRGVDFYNKLIISNSNLWEVWKGFWNNCRTVVVQCSFSFLPSHQLDSHGNLHWESILVLYQIPYWVSWTLIMLLILSFKCGLITFYLFIRMPTYWSLCIVCIMMQSLKLNWLHLHYDLTFRINKNKWLIDLFDLDRVPFSLSVTSGRLCWEAFLPTSKQN